MALNLKHSENGSKWLLILFYIVTMELKNNEEGVEISLEKEDEKVEVRFFFCIMYLIRI